MDVFHQHLFVRYYAGIIWLAYTRSHLFYDDKSRNGKRYSFANMITFCCHLRGEIQSKLLYKWISFAIQTFVIIEEMAFAILCFWSSNWVGFTKDSLELKVILSDLIGSDSMGPNQILILFVGSDQSFLHYWDLIVLMSKSILSDTMGSNQILFVGSGQSFLLLGSDCFDV